MIVVLWEVGEAVSQTALYTEVYEDDSVQVFYKNTILTNLPMTAAQAYGESIAKSIKAAKPVAEKLGFTESVPSSVEVMVAPSTTTESGSYCSFNELIYIRPGLSGTSMLTSPPHEYFHAMQDDFYLMGFAAAASAAGSTSDVYSWTEASAVWFSSLLFPGAQDDYIKGVLTVPGNGYLRCPLNSTVQAAAYSKASFVQYAASEKNNFVFDVTSVPHREGDSPRRHGDSEERWREFEEIPEKESRSNFRHGIDWSGTGEQQRLRRPNSSSSNDRSVSEQGRPFPWADLFVNLLPIFSVPPCLQRSGW
jgi:hypothetical protein